MLALGNSIGLTVAGIALMAAVRRRRGSAALRGTPRTAATGLAAAAAGAAAGAAVGAALSPTGKVTSGLVAVLAAACALAVFTAVAYVLDSGELRAAIASVRRAALR